MRIVITDVTEMHQGNYCVAGWRTSTGRMLRTLPEGGNWTGQLLARNQIAPGAMIEFQATGASPTGLYPHLTEDTPIDPTTIRLLSKRRQQWFGVSAPPTAATL